MKRYLKVKYLTIAVFVASYTVALEWIQQKAPEVKKPIAESSIVMNPKVFNDLTRSDMKTLERFLRGSLSWRVTEEDGRTVAQLRNITDNRFEALSGGYTKGHNGWAIVRLVFSEQRANDWWSYYK